MTDKEKLQKALEALKNIATNGNPLSTVISQRQFAAKVYAELTAPRMETVEVKRWMCSVCNAMVGQDTVKRGYCPNDNGPLVELTGTYSRPIEKKEEVWEGKIVTSDGHWLKIYLDGARNGYEDSRVEVSLLKGE